MISPDKEILKALINLKQTSRDFAIVVKWFHDSLVIQSIENNSERDSTIKHVNSGRNLEVKDVLDQIEQADEQLKRLESTPQGEM